MPWKWNAATPLRWKWSTGHINGAFPGFVPALTRLPLLIDKKPVSAMFVTYLYRDPPATQDSATRCECLAEGSAAAVHELHGLWLLWLIVYTARTVKTALNVNKPRRGKELRHPSERVSGRPILCLSQLRNVNIRL